MDVLVTRVCNCITQRWTALPDGVRFKLREVPRVWCVRDKHDADPVVLVNEAKGKTQLLSKLAWEARCVH